MRENQSFQSRTGSFAMPVMPSAGLPWMVVLLWLGSSAPAQAQALVYLDPAVPIEQRVKDLIGRMTLEEKALMLYHNAPGIARLHIPAWGGWNQCLHGVWSKTPTTLFPVPIAMAATWDPELIREVSSAIADEARALYHSGARGPRGKHGLVYRAPVINLSRDPRWGRIQECFGEDPYLTSRIGVAYVKGLQGDDPQYLKVAATLKHFAVNNQEQGRFSLSAMVPERMLREYWLPHFRACAVEAKAQSLMAAYNAINGTPCAVNKRLLNDILRDEWGFEGFVVSDLGGIGQLMVGHHLTQNAPEAVAQALRAGCDLDDEQYRDALPAAVRAKLVSEEMVDRALARVLRVAFRLGVFDPLNRVPFSKTPVAVIDSPRHRELALRTEREAIVLLHNKDDFLPLDKDKLRTVAVLGPAAVRPEYGNYYGVAAKRVSPIDGLKSKLGSGGRLLYARGCGMTEVADPEEINQAAAVAKRADVAIVCLGTNGKVEAEGRDRKDLNLPGAQEELLKAVVAANANTVVILLNAGPLAVPWAKEHTAAILQAWYPGEEGGTAIAEIVFGDCCPAGRLPYTVYPSVQVIPPQTEYDVIKGFTYLYFTGKAVFPFGHGLSYTQFRYSNLRVKPQRLRPDGGVEVLVRVQNVGKRAGNEVVQLYVHQRISKVKRPFKGLRGFQRVHLQPGQEKELAFALSADQLSFYDVGKAAFVVEPGAVEVMLGASSQDIRVRAELELVAASK
jgi:beta-glucosidase